MSALATRLLVLGVVRIFEPANAYQLRRELMSWRVDQWANLNPGSVYNMLATLEKAGLVQRHGVTGVNGRPVTVYTTTGTGAAEFPDLIERGMRDVGDWAGIVDLRAALSFLPFLTRERALAALGDRLTGLGQAVAEMGAITQALKAEAGAPPHVLAEFGLEERIMLAQAAWLAEYRERIAAGEFSFAGDAADWHPPMGDPGEAMQRDRLHYLPQLDHLDST